MTNETGSKENDKQQNVCLHTPDSFQCFCRPTVSNIEALQMRMAFDLVQPLTVDLTSISSLQNNHLVPYYIGPRLMNIYAPSM